MISPIFWPDRSMKQVDLPVPLKLGNELLIDSFSDGAVASEGIEQAFGRPVDGLSN